MNCKANNCPLRVDFITHWHEKEPGEKTARPKWGVCWYHRHASADDWTKTTERIRQNILPIMVTRAIKGIDDATFKPMPGESVGAYVERCESNLNKIIYGEIDQDDASENFAKIIQLLGE